VWRWNGAATKRMRINKLYGGAASGASRAMGWSLGLWCATQNKSLLLRVNYTAISPMTDMTLFIFCHIFATTFLEIVSFRLFIAGIFGSRRFTFYAEYVSNLYRPMWHFAVVKELGNAQSATVSASVCRLYV